MMSNMPAATRAEPATIVRVRFMPNAGISVATNHTPAITMSRKPASASFIPVAEVIASTAVQDR